MPTDLRIALCTVPDEETAGQIADALVSEKLAACVNIIPSVMSVYRWNDAIEHSQELMLLIKTSESVWPLLEARILELHPYELPEIITVPIHTGQADYIKWIKTSLTTP
jgi:periplasmic divalent cation tolerance protein